MVSRRLSVKTNIGRATQGGNLRPWESYYLPLMRRTARDLVKELNSVLDQFEAVSPEIMLEVLEPTMELADYYCPKDTHATVNSRYLRQTSSGRSPRVEAGYGFRGKPWYAAMVHERTWVPHRAPTRSKWLQAAMMEDLGNIYNRLTAQYSRFMG